MLGVVDEEVGRAGEGEQQVAHARHARDPHRPRRGWRRVAVRLRWKDITHKVELTLVSDVLSDCPTAKPFLPVDHTKYESTHWSALAPPCAPC